MRTRREINNDITFNQECVEVWKNKQPGQSGYSQAELDRKISLRQECLTNRRKELLTVVSAELGAAHNEDAALYHAIRRAEGYGYRNKVNALRKERATVMATIKHLNREREDLVNQINQENNVIPTGSRNIDHEIDQSVTTPGTDPEEAVKQRIQLLKTELTERRDRAQKFVESNQASIEQLARQQAARRAEIDALNLAIDAL